MCLYITDTTGKVVDNANVLLGKKVIPFDKKTNLYCLRNKKVEGWISVNYECVQNFFDIKNNYAYPKGKIFLSKFLYHSPFKIVWLPTSFVISLPLDLAKTIVRFRRMGGVYRITQPFYDVVNSIQYGQLHGFLYKIQSIFDPNRRYKNLKAQYVLSQPKYKPGDTVRFKLYLFDKKMKPLRTAVYASLLSQKEFPLGKIKPQQPGIFSFEFPLLNKYDLKLDRNISIFIKSDSIHGYHIAYLNFYYEEYDLKSNEFSLTTTKPEYLGYETVTIKCKGTDENELIVPDAKVNLTITTQNISEWHTNSVFVPDTIWVHKQDLDPIGETKINIPDSVFPTVDAEYAIKAVFLNAANERHEQNISFHKRMTREKILFQLINDSIYVCYTLNGDTLTKSGFLLIPELKIAKNIVFPHKEKFNAFTNSYHAYTDSCAENFYINEYTADIDCSTLRNADSVSVYINNPHKLPCFFFIYKKNKCIFRSNEDQIYFTCKNTTKENYFVSLHYIVGGKTITKEYCIAYNESKITLKPIEPLSVYPGQKVKISIAATDIKGTPLQNADILAFANTSKFKNQTIPTLPQKKQEFADRSIFYSFSDFTEFSKQKSKSFKLDYSFWKPILGIDTIELYKFLYPGYNIYKSTVTINDSFAQLAPYIVKNGTLDAIHFIYIDEMPVYIAIAKELKPFSFRVYPGKHRIKIRGTNNMYIIDSLEIKKNTKTIISFDTETIPFSVKTEKMPAKYTPKETWIVNSYCFNVSANDEIFDRYLKYFERYEYLPANKYNYVAGPISGGYVKYASKLGYEHLFKIENGYRYEFHKNYYKLICNSPLVSNNESLFNDYPSRNFRDIAWTYDSISSLWNKKTIELQRTDPGFIVPKQTYPGQGKLILAFYPEKPEFKYQIKNIVILPSSLNKDALIYPGNQSVFEGLDAEKHTIYFLLNDNRYFVLNNVLIKANGQNYIRYNPSEPFKNDSTIESVNRILRERSLNQTDKDLLNNSSKQVFDISEKMITRALRLTDLQPCTDGILFSGKVVDKSNQSLPGVCILVDGTKIGSISDLDGNYSICVPINSTKLNVQFIGYKNHAIDLVNSPETITVLEEDIVSLDEVVVVGYGTIQKRDMTTSVAMVSSGATTSFNFLENSLQGSVAGIEISENSLGSQLTNIRIRGTSSIDAKKQPLYVIDGVPFEGNTLDLNSDEIGSIEVLKESAAKAIYGSRAANGVIIINRKKTLSNINNSGEHDAVQQQDGIRRNFADLAFWKPALLTDKNGVASFEVTFPDDITSWKTYYLLWSDKGSAQKEGLIKSYKPLVATLSTPKFLVTGDTAICIGKAANYNADSVTITTTARVNNLEIFNQEKKMLNSVIDSISVSSESADSISITYLLKKKNGYTDGEKRQIPSFQAGIIENIGKFLVLNNDTTFTLVRDKNLGPLRIHAESDEKGIILDEIKHVHEYSYLCNEQAASKLKALLILKQIYKVTQTKFLYEKDINKLIKKLTESTASTGGWGWWPNCSYSSWISIHVCEALEKARKAGYSVSINNQQHLNYLVYNFSIVPDAEKIRYIKLMYLLNSENNYADYIQKINYKNLTFCEKLDYIELQQQFDMKPKIDTLLNSRKETALGNSYWGTDSYSLFIDATPLSLAIYRIFKHDSFHTELLPKIRNFLFERRGSLHWRNTYESTNILEVLVEDVIKAKQIPSKSWLTMNKIKYENLEKYPCDTLVQDDSINITKSGYYPIYISYSQQHWNKNPSSFSGNFKVKTYFEKRGTTLKAGEPVVLTAEVEVIHASDYVMIEIPIPAGCSYETKTSFYRNENYREYFNNKVAIFSSFLNEGTYKYTIKLIPRYTGTYNLNPANAELMYFPTLFGREGIKKVYIK